MLNADDPQTIRSLRLLKHTIETIRRPIVMWIGAGTSRWLGYQSWTDLARGFRRHFFQQRIPGFSNDHAVKLIESGKLPSFFQLCKQSDSAQYHRLLAASFAPRPDTGEYSRFISLLQRLAPSYLLTTNVDEALENRLHEILVLQRTDLSRCLELFGRDSSFLAKLHGTSSAIETAIFTEDDYMSLTTNPSYMQFIKHTFAACTVIFLGYGVVDDYVLTLLQQNSKEMRLFGSGPHFVVTSEEQKTIPGVHRIAYETKRFRDHRAAMTILDYIWQSKQLMQERGFQIDAIDTERMPAKASSPAATGYYISDFKPPGTWASASSVTAKHENGQEMQFTVGLGFTNEEVPHTISTAVHDLIVGLTCFDYVYIPVLSVGAAHQTLQPDRFWCLVTSGCLKFVHIEHEPAVGWSRGELFGDLTLMAVLAEDKTQNRPASEVIRQQINILPGKEAEGEKLLCQAEKQTVTFRDGARLEIASLVRNALLMPGVAALLGIGDAILPSQAPQWLTFPYLRMAHLVHTGALCDELGLHAAKLPFGGVQLTTAAFGIQTASEWAETYASWAISGSYYTDLGAYALQNPSIIDVILKFRESAEGEAFRREARDRLLQGHGSEFTVSVNAGLARNIPPAVLQAAHNKIAVLMMADPASTKTPAIWGSALHSDDSTVLWRRKAQRRLLELCKARGIGGDDPCICGSGHKLRLCCLAPLRH